MKVLTTLNRPADGLMLGVDRILKQAGMEADSIELIMHGTTLATALIERRGAKTALITTEGHRDALDQFRVCTMSAAK